MLFPRFTAAATLLVFLPSCGRLAENYRYESGIRPEPPKKRMTAGKFGMSVVRGTTLSAIRQPGTTARIGGMVLWQRPFELLTGNVPGFSRLQPRPPFAPGSEGFEGLLDEQRIPRPVMGKITWLVDGHRFVPELERQIAAARETVDTQVYIFDNDDAAVDLADRLKRQSGTARVRVIFDDLGSSVAWSKDPETPLPAGFEPPDNMSSYLRDGSNVKVRSMLNPFLVCDHTKLHVFDGKVAVMGCANIGREYRSEWHDLMFRVEGPAVAELQKDYNRTWKRADPWGWFGMFGRKELVNEPAAVGGEIPLRVIRTDPAAGRREIQKAMVLAIRAARRRIWIEDPYIANDDVTEALEAAARRGVDVRLIYPGKNDSKLMDIANRVFADKLVKAGGKAYAYPKMTHLKVMICDDWACVGSANLDTLSMRINRELNLCFRNSPALRELIAKVFEPDFAISRPHRTGEKKPAGPLIEAVADQL
jgi:cardiolipin synthase